MLRLIHVKPRPKLLLLLIVKRKTLWAIIVLILLHDWQQTLLVKHLFVIWLNRFTIIFAAVCVCVGKLAFHIFLIMILYPFSLPGLSWTHGSPLSMLVCLFQFVLVASLITRTWSLTNLSPKGFQPDAAWLSFFFYAFFVLPNINSFWQQATLKQNLHY